MSVERDWRDHHANESEKALDHEVVKAVMAEFADNMGFELKGLPRYGLCKVATYAAQVARAQALGFDPDLLRMSPTEQNEAVMRKARMAAERGVPVWVIEANQREEGRSDG